MESTAQRVSCHRKMQGLTQEQFAERLGVSRQTLAMWETGKRLPTDSVAILAARFLQLDEEEILTLLRHERLQQRVKQLQEQYGASILIVDAPEGIGTAMNTEKQHAHSSQRGVHMAITQIHKSIGFELPEDVSLVTGRHGGSFDAPFERPQPEERLTLKMLVYSEDETFIPNWHYIGYCAIEDDLGNRFRPIAMGMCASLPPDGIGGGSIQAYAQFRYAPEARSIAVQQGIANARDQDCDHILFEQVPVRGGETSRQFNNIGVTYLGVQSIVVGRPGNETEFTQVSLRLGERGDPRYVGVPRVTDNLGNIYDTCGFSWTLDERNEEGFQLQGLAKGAESICFEYLIARTVLDFEFRDLPIPS